jgi:hypothetical protein
VSLAAWPFLPFTELVVFNARYLLPGLLIGMTLAAIAPILLRGARARAVPWLFALLTALGAVQTMPPRGLVATVLVIAATLAAAEGLRRRPMKSARVRRTALGAVAALVVVAGAAVADRYQRNRYAVDAFQFEGPAAPAVKRLFDWAKHRHGSRIAMEGGELQYPLYGDLLANRVEYVGVDRRDGGFGRIDSCPLWRRSINSGGYDYVVTVPWGSLSKSPYEPSPHASWTESDRAAEPVLRPGAGISVFRIDGPLAPAECRDDRRVAVGPRAPRAVR